jgi:hypothetical protein
MIIGFGSRAWQRLRLHSLVDPSADSGQSTKKNARPAKGGALTPDARPASSEFTKAKKSPEEDVSPQINVRSRRRRPRRMLRRRPRS